MAGGGSDEVFLIGPVKIDIPILRIFILWLLPREPQDACQDAILPAPWLHDEARRLAAFEFHPQGGTCPDFLVDKKSSGRSFEAAGGASEAETRC